MYENEHYKNMSGKSLSRQESIDSMASSEFDSFSDSISGSPEEAMADVAASILIPNPTTQSTDLHSLNAKSDTPDTIGSLVNSLHFQQQKPQPLKKKQKKKSFSMFHRRGLKKSKNEASRMSESFSALGAVTNQMMASDNHLFLNRSWNSLSFKQEDSPDSGRKFGSYNSLTSAETKAQVQELTDRELVETLVNPRPSISWTQPSEVRRPSISLTQPSEQLPKYAERTKSVSYPGMEYMVNVTLMSGHNLAIRDRTGSSDPYIKFKHPPFKYRSAVIHCNLNPVWNENFSFKTSFLDNPLLVRVYDHDYGSLDDFMGGQTIDLASYLNGEPHITEVGLVDEDAPKSGSLGFIRLSLKVSPVTEKEAIMNFSDTKKNNKCGNSRVWNSILNVTLMEGKNLTALELNGLTDPYCKFKLGSQKFKSKTLSKTSNPKWRERFNLRMYDNFYSLHVEVWDKHFPQNDDFIGGCSVDLSTLSRDSTHNFVLPLVWEGNLIAESTIQFNLSISGTTVEEDKSEFSLDSVKKPYGFIRSLDIGAIKERNIGHLSLRIDRVMDLATCNCFVLVELGDTCVRTQTKAKTFSPVWDKIFNFIVRDIHDELEVMVFKVGIRNDQLLGKVSIPLHRLEDGYKGYMLKDKNCLSRTRGILCMETALVYQPVRAMIRTVNPRENKPLDVEQKLQRKVLMDNIKRTSNLLRTIISSVELAKSVFSWENKQLSVVSFLLFILATLFGELWMVFLGGMLLFLYQYLSIYIKNNHIWQNPVSSNAHMITSQSSRISIDDGDGSDFSDLEDNKQTNIKAKFKQFQQILVIVQNVLGEVTDMEEGIRNLLNWRVPFLSWMAIVVFLGGTVLFYLVSLRYVILVWGINKFTKRLRKPNYIDNNELLDFLSRCPTNKQLEQWDDLPLVVHQKQVLHDFKAGMAAHKDAKKQK